MVTKRSKNIPPFTVMDVLESAQELEESGREITHLEIGQPDFPTPEVITQAATAALRAGRTTYTHSMGLIKLREAISLHYKENYGVKVNPENILITTGTSPALFLALSALVEKGDQVILTDPSYTCYKNTISFIGGKPVFVPIYDSEGYQINPERLKDAISEKTRAILINSPSNPTGTTLSKETLAQISTLSEKHGFYIISDEIYHGLVYKGKTVSALQVSDNAFIVNGFSKTYAMTGWRLGFLIAPKNFIRPLQKMQQNFFICASHFVQYGGIAALQKAAPYLEKMKAQYNKRRNYLIPELRNMGLKIMTEPNGAFYVLANARRFSESSYQLTFRILEEAEVAVAPGIDFGKNSEGFLRFSYATSLKNIKKAVPKLKTFFRKEAKK